jgi:thioredoxin
MITHLGEDELESKVHGASGVVLVELSAKWCPPCRAQERVLARFSAAHPEVPVFAVDVEEAPRISAMYGVRAMPTLLVFRDGALERTAVGLQSDARVAELVGRR